MTTKITVLVGTMTGTAQLVAQELELTWDDGDTQVETLLMDGLEDHRRRTGDQCEASRGFPDLSQLRYGVFGLGDRTYAETFNFGGKRFDDLLSELGARRIGERVQHDASSGILPEETAVEWGAEWLEQARAAVAQAA